MSVTTPVEWLRQTLLPPIGDLVAEVNDDVDAKLYVERPTHYREFVGVVDLSERMLRDRLQEIGFEPNPIASFKHIRDSNIKETGSLALRADINNDGELVQDTWADHQIHVILFEIDSDAGTTAVFAHWEYSWLTHPLKHYRGIGVNDVFGATRVQDLLDEHGVDYRTTDWTEVSLDG